MELTEVEYNKLRFQVDAQRRVRRGAYGVLDRFVPGWLDNISEAMLNLADGNSCVIGQIAANNMEEQFRRWCDARDVTVEGIREPPQEVPYHDCNCHYCGFHDHEDSEPFQPTATYSRDYASGRQLIEWIADQQGITFPTYGHVVWDVAHGFTIDFRTDGNFYELTEHDMWRILTETWVELIQERKAAEVVS
jgi:hypothetical protein